MCFGMHLRLTVMDKSSFPNDPMDSWNDLVLVLENMRDELVKLSLAMHDYRFDCDVENRMLASKILHNTLERSKRRLV